MWWKVYSNKSSSYCRRSPVLLVSALRTGLPVSVPLALSVLSFALPIFRSLVRRFKNLFKWHEKSFVVYIKNVYVITFLVNIFIRCVVDSLFSSSTTSSSSSSSSNAQHNQTKKQEKKKKKLFLHRCHQIVCAASAYSACRCRYFIWFAK